MILPPLREGIERDGHSYYAIELTIQESFNPKYKSSLDPYVFCQRRKLSSFLHYLQENLHRGLSYSY